MRLPTKSPRRWTNPAPWIAEWNRSALETLREPLESGHIRIARAARSVQYPARFQLVAAMIRVCAIVRSSVH
ncbi:putative ATPase with chaperone activity [Stenotrophomonas sp. PvP093]|nr:putative ATPase with chaperone activity [Stenotrophomonas sp. PvP093]